MRKEWAVAVSELTKKQKYAISELDPFGNFAITGPPGSGKTNVLLLRAKYLLSKFEDRSVLVLVFTSALKDFVKKGVQEYKVDPGIVQTFHGWGKNYLRDFDYEIDDNFDDVAPLLSSVVKKNGKPIIDFLLVDEAQDFSKEIISLFFKISKNVALYYDRSQSIHTIDDSLESRYPPSIRPFSKKFKEIVELDKSHRVPYKIAQLAASILPKSNLLELTVEDEKGDFPVYQSFSNVDNEIAFIKERVEDLPNENPDYNFVILQKTNKANLPEIYDKMHDSGLKVETIVYGLPPCNYNNTVPKLITYHSVKGLEFDVVFAAGATPSAFTGAPRDKYLAFVAVTRSKSRVFITGAPGISKVFKPPVDKALEKEVRLEDLFEQL